MGVTPDDDALVFAGPPSRRPDGTCAGPVTSLQGVNLERLCIDGTADPRGINWGATLKLSPHTIPAWRPCGAECGVLSSRRPPTSIAAGVGLRRVTPGPAGVVELNVGVGAISPLLDGGEHPLLVPRFRVTVRDRGREQSIRLHRAAGAFRGRLPVGATSCRLSGIVNDATFLRYYGRPRPRTFRFPCHPPRGKQWLLRSLGVPGPVVSDAFSLGA